MCFISSLIVIYDSIIEKLNVTWYIDVYNTLISYIVNTYVETRLSLNKCIVYNIEGSEQLRLTGEDCQFGGSVNLKIVGAIIKLYRCYIPVTQIHSEYNETIELSQCECNDILLDNSNSTIRLKDCNVGSLLYGAGFAIGFIDDKTRVNGTIDVASWCGAYNFGGGRTFLVGEKRYNPKAVTGEYIGYINTVNGWKGFGLIA